MRGTFAFIKATEKVFGNDSLNTASYRLGFGNVALSRLDESTTHRYWSTTPDCFK